jgi:hypothetical protein
MKRHILRLVLTLCLLVSARAAAQAPAPIARDQNSSRQAQMYEDVEIMRRLLNGKLQRYGASGVAANAAWKNSCMACHDTVHGTGAAVLDYDNDGWLDLFVTNAHGGHVLYRNEGNGKFKDVTNEVGLDRFVLDATGTAHGLGAPHILDTEGTYLKGRGVVFTLTLPPPQGDPRPAPEATPDKPLTDWERIRREVRKEKPAEAAAKPRKEATLAEVILKVLAENGQHFTQLGLDESLTVAVTFRAPTAVSVGVAMGDVDGDGNMTNFAIHALRAAPQTDKPDAHASPAKPQAKDKPASTAQDYLLLGDLHVKQGKLSEAISTYQKALELKPDGRQAALLHQQLARTYLLMQKDDEARQALQKAMESLTRVQGEQPKPPKQADTAPTPLPSKLIISVPKRALDMVAMGKMTFEEFTKAATVEYLTFPTQK